MVQGTLQDPGFKSMRFAPPTNPRKKSQIMHPFAPILMKQRGNCFAFTLISTFFLHFKLNSTDRNERNIE